MKRTIYQPPKCSCGAKLTRAFGYVKHHYVFSEDIGMYLTNDGGIEVRILCPMCRADVSGLFPKGISNFRSWGPENK